MCMRNDGSGGVRGSRTQRRCSKSASIDRTPQLRTTTEQTQKKTTGRRTSHGRTRAHTTTIDSQSYVARFILDGERCAHCRPATVAQFRRVNSNRPTTRDTNCTSAYPLLTPPPATSDESFTFEGPDVFIRRHEWRRCRSDQSVVAEPLVGPPIVRCRRRWECTDHVHTILHRITLPHAHTLVTHARTRTPAVIRCGVARESARIPTRAPSGGGDHPLSGGESHTRKHTIRERDG
jgi:hypothetical protein